MGDEVISCIVWKHAPDLKGQCHYKNYRTLKTVVDRYVRRKYTGWNVGSEVVRPFLDIGKRNVVLEIYTDKDPVC
jgi:hypothetical protein